MTVLTLKDFHFDLPEQLVAHEPLDQRDASRMMVRDKCGTLYDQSVKDLIRFLPKNSLLILNNTKVFPSRLVGFLESGGKAEIFLLENTGSTAQSSIWVGLGKPFRKFRPGKKIHFQDNLSAEILGTSGPGELTPTVTLDFNLSGGDIHSWLGKNGIVPLPPYIKRAETVPAFLSPDTARYQTVYAKNTGSVAAPTAGLHLTAELLDSLKLQGIQIAYTCLHVGAGTFLPVKSHRISDHKMHSEKYSVPSETLTAILQAKKSGRSIVAVGTTTFRSLESLSGKFPELSEVDIHEAGDRWHETDLFVYPRSPEYRYQPHFFNGILTNFHQPESTLLMLIAALVGYNEMSAAYRWAIERNYRFYSYGDCCLFWI